MGDGLCWKYIQYNVNHLTQVYLQQRPSLNKTHSDDFAHMNILTFQDQ